MATEYSSVRVKKELYDNIKKLYKDDERFIMQWWVEDAIRAKLNKEKNSGK